MKIDIYEVLKKAALAAGKIQLDYYDQKFEISQKTSPSDLVTEVDYKSQDAIIKSLTESMITKGIKKEDVGFIAEEKGMEKIAQHLFIIDPLDGTGNYVDHNGSFSTSIAYLVDGETLAGMVYQPTEDTQYFAEKEKGAYLVRDNVKTKIELESKTLEDSKIAFNTSRSPEVTESILKILQKLVKRVRRVRETRSAVLTMLSLVQNKFQVAISSKNYIWDVAAAKLIIEEAGGVVTDWSGEAITLDLQDVKKTYTPLTSVKNLSAEIISVINN